MNPNTVEKILLVKMITNLYLDGPFAKKIFEEEILGIYKWGSRLWGNDTEDSDLDYVIIIQDGSGIFIGKNGYIQLESETVDLHILSESEYKKRLNECDEMSLSCYIQYDPILKYEYKFNIDKTKLRKSFSAKANNSYVKAKKKLTVEDPSEENLKLAWKSMWHSFRILILGTKLAKGFKYIDTELLMRQINGIEDNFKLYKNDWETLHKIYKPICNQLSTEFKKVAPKGK